MTRLKTRLQHGDPDGGAVLILALVFVTVVGLVGGAIALFAGDSLAQTTGIQGDRSRQFAANSAVQVAIQRVRDMTSLSTAPGYSTNGNPMNPCPTTDVAIPENGVYGNPSNETFTVDCVVGYSPGSFERSITFAACPQGATCLTGQSTFTPKPGANAIVVTTAVYDDLATGYTFATGTTNGSGGWNVGGAVNVVGWNVTKANN